MRFLFDFELHVIHRVLKTHDVVAVGAFVNGVPKGFSSFQVFHRQYAKAKHFHFPLPITGQFGRSAQTLKGRASKHFDNPRNRGYLFELMVQEPFQSDLRSYLISYLTDTLGVSSFLRPLAKPVAVESAEPAGELGTQLSGDTFAKLQAPSSQVLVCCLSLWDLTLDEAELLAKMMSAIGLTKNQWQVVVGSHRALTQNLTELSGLVAILAFDNGLTDASQKFVGQSKQAIQVKSLPHPGQLIKSPYLKKGVWEELKEVRALLDLVPQR